MAFAATPSMATMQDTYTISPAFGRNAHIFQPPQSPATSLIATPSFATANDYFSTGSRKRARPDSSHDVDSSSALFQTPGRVLSPAPSDVGFAGGTGKIQDSMLVNEMYTLADGYDTPGLQAMSETEAWNAHDQDERRRCCRDHNIGNGRTTSSQLPGPLARERNGVPRMPSSPNGPPSTWTSLAFSFVGKVFGFGSSVVRGFYAGGGKGFDLRHSPLRPMLVSREPCPTPLPGSWHEDEFLGDFEQDNPRPALAAQPRPSNKRRQTDRDTWVLVGTPDLPSSPKRKASSTSIPRSNLASRPSASRASSRRSLAPVPRRQSSQAVYSTGSPMAPSATVIAERRASFAPLRSTSRPSSSHQEISADASNTSYISPEAERYVKRRAKQDRQADARITDMSSKLADLIRQGQAALGTKVSVEDATGSEEVDEGFMDEEW